MKTIHHFPTGFCLLENTVKIILYFQTIQNYFIKNMNYCKYQVPLGLKSQVPLSLVYLIGFSGWGQAVKFECDKY